MAIYGNKMTVMWADCPRADLIDAWREGLAKVTGSAIGEALRRTPAAHPEWPPTMGQFLALCGPIRSEPAHRTFTPALPQPEPQPERVAEILASSRLGKPAKDCRKWARDIMAMEERGDRSLPMVSYEMARAALTVSDQ